MSGWYDLIQYPQVVEPVLPPPAPTLDGWVQPTSQPVPPPVPPNVGPEVAGLGEPIPDPAPDLDTWFVLTAQPVLPRVRPNVGPSFTSLGDPIPDDAGLPVFDWNPPTEHPVEGFTLVQGGAAILVRPLFVFDWFVPTNQPVLPKPPENVGPGSVVGLGEPIPDPPPGLDTWYRPLSEPVLPKPPENEGSSLLNPYVVPPVPDLDNWYVPLAEPVLPKTPPNVGPGFVSLGDPIVDPVPELTYQVNINPIVGPQRSPHLLPAASMVMGAEIPIKIYDRGTEWFCIKDAGVTEWFKITDSGVENF